MLSTIGSIASQGGLIRFQDIVIPTETFRMHHEPNNYISNAYIQQAPQYMYETGWSTSILDISIENGILDFGSIVGNRYIAMLYGQYESGGCNSTVYFIWSLEYTDGTEITIAYVSQSSYEGWYDPGSPLYISAYPGPIMVGNKIPYRFRMNYTGGGHSGDFDGVFELNEIRYFSFIRK